MSDSKTERPFDPGSRPAGLESLLGEIPEALLDERIWYAAELSERYAVDLSLEILTALDLDGALRAGGTLDELMESREIAAGLRPALDSLLRRLAAAGEVEATGEPPRFRAAALRRGASAALRAAALAHDPSLEPALALLDVAAASYPEIAAGRTSGDQALLQPSRVGLWLGYFDNANPVYALSNRIAAVAAANRLPPEGAFRILEVGAGAGSAAEALIEEIERRGRTGDIERYVLTEPHPFFRRRAERSLRVRFPELSFEFRSLDIDEAVVPEELEGRFDLLFAVNVVHVARRLVESLARLANLLVPGGVLVAGECFRLFRGQTVPADLVFQLFRGFTHAELDAAHRPHHGFLEPAVWRGAFSAAGFAAVDTVPDLDRIRDIYPRFFAGAVCGRRPVQSSSNDRPEVA